MYYMYWFPYGGEGWELGGRDIGIGGRHHSIHFCAI